MKLSTKNVDLTPNEDSGNFMNRILQPGNHKIKIHSILLRPERDIKFGEKIILSVETEPIGNGFQGFPINKDDLSKGYYEGQTGQVSMSRWGYKDFTTTMGHEISRNDELFKAVGILCREIGLVAWWDAQDAKYDTVDQLIQAFISERPFDGVWFHAVIAGREFLSKDNKHINHELYFPREERVLGKAYSLNPEKVQKYNELLHLEKIKAKPEVTSTSLEKSIPEQSKVTPESNKPVSIKETETNPAVLAFLNDGPTNKEITSPFTDEVLNDANNQNAELNPIITADNSNKLPWE